mgnify:CR=1 FL=1
MLEPSSREVTIPWTPKPSHELPVAIAWLSKLIIDAVVARDADEAIRWVVIELGLVGAQTLVTRSLALVRQTLGARLAVDTNAKILEKAISLDLRHFEDAEFYDRLTRARREASGVQSMPSRRSPSARSRYEARCAIDARCAAGCATMAIPLS